VGYGQGSKLVTWQATTGAHTTREGDQMSGGHFDYRQFELQKMADEIEQLVLDNANQDWEDKYEQRTIDEFNKTIKLLREAYVYVQRIDWLVSGDDNVIEFHKRLKEQLNDRNAK
jgi:hypothetical protein